MNSRIITIDIETLPAPATASQTHDAIVSAPSQDSGLSGDEGRLLCIGFCDEDAAGTRKATRGVLGWDHAAANLHLDERRTLADFWELMRSFRPCVDRIVGHNIFNFDLLFIYKRSIICGVRPSVELSFRRYANQPIYDTMCEWERWNMRHKVSLDRLARLLGLPSPKTDDVDGSRVAELCLAGEHRAIREYCMRDVEATRQVFRRMTFMSDPPSCTPSLRRTNRLRTSHVALAS